MYMSKENLVAELSLEFAVRIVNLNKYLRLNKKEFVISAQVLRSGTSICDRRTVQVFEQGLTSNDRFIGHHNKKGKRRGQNQPQ